MSPTQFYLFFPLISLYRFRTALSEKQLQIEKNKEQHRTQPSPSISIERQYQSKSNGKMSIEDDEMCYVEMHSYNDIGGSFMGPEVHHNRGLSAAAMRAKRLNNQNDRMLIYYPSKQRSKKARDIITINR